MGSYATYTNVYTKSPRLSTVASLTTAEIEESIAEVESEINTGLRHCGYTTPISNANDIVMLRRFVAEKAAAMSYHEAFLDETAPNYITTYEADYTAFMLRVRECKFTLESTVSGNASTLTTGVLTLRSDMRFADDNEENDNDGT